MLMSIDTAVQVLRETASSMRASADQDKRSVTDMAADAIDVVLRTLTVKVAAGQPPRGFTLVPVTPSRAHLDSIAIRQNHDFGLMDERQRDNLRRFALQMYEECTGRGFYKFNVSYHPAPVKDKQGGRSAVVDALANSLSDTYTCSRVWEAWQYGTMGPDDFNPVTDDDNLLSEIADAVIAAMQGGESC